MVDPIEIQLDEIEIHVLKTQADVDRLMRDFSKPDYKAASKAAGMGFPEAGGGGFMDQVIKAIGGKGGALGAAGLAGGAAAAGIMILADVIKEALSNSKILTTVLGTISKALGLLIDVILLPFLPILTVGIIWLFQGIMLFHKLWSSIWTSKVIQNLVLGIKTVSDFLAKGISSYFNTQFQFVGAGADMIWTVLQWSYNLATSNGVIGLSLAIVLGPVGLLLNWLWNVVKGNEIVQFSLNFVLGAAGDVLYWLMSVVSTGIRVQLDFINNATQAVTSGVSGAAEAVGGAISNPGSWLEGVMKGGWLPQFEQGGTVPGQGPQLAVVHGGETVTPKGQNGGTTTIIIQGYTDAKLQGVIETVLRRQNNRFNS